jgi:DNA-binding MarR family transcriptional regulator
MKQRIEEVLKIDPTQLNAYSTGLLQGKAYRVLNSALTKALVAYDLNIPEWKLLGQLYDHGTMKLAKLADRLNVEPPLVTSLVDTLEKKELVTRTNDPKDKRAKLIKSTKKGNSLIPQVEPLVKAAMGKLLIGISREQLHMYITVLQTIVNNSTL